MSTLSENQWQALFNEQENSGLTIVAFCRERNIRPQTFYTRRYKHRKRCAADSDVGNEDFVEVTNVPVHREHSQLITLQYGDVSITIPAHFDITRLTQLVKGLN